VYEDICRESEERYPYSRIGDNQRNNDLICHESVLLILKHKYSLRGDVSEIIGEISERGTETKVYNHYNIQWKQL
jgi:hypothetical protein